MAADPGAKGEALKVTVQLSGPLRALGAEDGGSVECAEGCDAAAALEAFAATRGAALAEALRNPSLLVFVNGEQSARGEQRVLSEGDEVLVLAPVSGG